MYVGDDDPQTLRMPRDVRAARRLASRLRKGKDARLKKVEDVRSALDAGDYENALKLSVAIDRMLDELLK
ncbi:MAG: hypothetical protein QM770_00500 [Tepidisphaeraceae bacterium]